MTDEELAIRATSLFIAMGGACRWGECFRASHCEWNGRRLVWPEFGDILDLERGAIVSEEELPESEALKLPWRPLHGWDGACDEVLAPLL